jgi:hypothetical protein
MADAVALFFFGYSSFEDPPGISAGHHVPRNLARSPFGENDQASRKAPDTAPADSL